MAIVLKFLDKGECRRSRIGSLSWEQVLGAAAATFPELRRDSFELRYRDDEDDVCLLSSATFEDFAHLNQHATTVRLEVLRKAPLVPPPPPPPASRVADAAADASMGDVEQPSWGSSRPVPGSLPSFLKDLLVQLWRASALAGGDALAALLAHFAPTLLQLVQGERDGIDRAAAESPLLVRSLLESVREGLEAFPQLQETQMALDRMLQAERLEGVGAASEALLRAFTQLSFEQQRDIVSVALSGVLEKLLQLVPDEASPADRGWVHDSFCDGCGTHPILGPCFRCTACRGHGDSYSLCSSCYLQKDTLHPSHIFRCLPPPSGKGLGKGWGYDLSGALAEEPSDGRAGASCTDGGSGWTCKGKGPAKGGSGGKSWGKGKSLGKSWGKSWDEGWGKGKGKGWGTDWETGDSTFPDSCDGSGSSDDFWEEVVAPRTPRPRVLLKQAVRHAKHVCKKMKKEARERWKRAKKTWKAWKKGKSQSSRLGAVEARVRFKAAKQAWKKEKRQGKDFIKRFQAACEGPSSSSSGAMVPPPADEDGAGMEGSGYMDDSFMGSEHVDDGLYPHHPELLIADSYSLESA